jgi:hypothetical protein
MHIRADVFAALRDGRSSAVSFTAENRKSQRASRKVSPESSIVVANYLLLIVTPGRVSVRNGVSGNPAPLYMLTTGLLAQP